MLKITFGAKHLNVVSFWFMLYMLVNIKTGKRGNAGIKHSETAAVRMSSPCHQLDRMAQKVRNCFCAAFTF